MIELRTDQLVFSFPEVHPSARMTIEFQRTLRIPDDDTTYPLPPGMGRFPIRHVDDHVDRIPEQWIRHGGVMFPMFQSEAMWINFHAFYIGERRASYPFAVRTAAGKICAVSGEQWTDTLSPDSSRGAQNYLVVPQQPWLDGYAVEPGVIRQFVAMPLGAGYTAEEQLTGAAEHGGLQIQVNPMHGAEFERRFPVRPPMDDPDTLFWNSTCEMEQTLYSASEMGLAPGGRMKQQVYRDSYGLDSWNTDAASRCFVHIADSVSWRAITGEAPPTVPPTARDYDRAGLPWFAYYEENPVVGGTDALSRLKGVASIGTDRGVSPLPENETVTPTNVRALRRSLKPGQVREW